MRVISQRVAFAFFVLVLTMLTYCSTASADGKYFPSVIIDQELDIPSQSALLIYRNGIERLAIENNLKADEGEFGWILPLPAPPTEVNPMSPGVFSDLLYATAPLIEGEGNIGFELALRSSMLVIIIIPFILFAIVYPRLRWSSALLAILLLLIYIGFYHIVAFGDGVATASIAQIKEISKSVAGNYDVTTIRAENYAALDEWLSANGFRNLSAEDRGIIDSYIADGWVFVASKLRIEGTSFAKVHPLEFVFPAKQPVYPMRLTACGSNGLDLKLYTLSDNGLVVSGMKREFTGTVQCENPVVDMMPGIKGIQRRTWAGQTVIHDPDLLEMVWESSVLQRFTATLGRKDMNKDIYPAQVVDRPAERLLTVYLPRAAKNLSLRNAVNAVAITLLLSMVLPLFIRRIRLYPLKAFAVSCAIAFIVAVVTWFSIDKRDLNIMNIDWHALDSAYSQIEDACDGKYSSLDDLRAAIPGLVSSDAVGIVKEGYGFGEFSLYEDGAFMCIYARNADRSGRFPNLYIIGKEKKE